MIFIGIVIYFAAAALFVTSVAHAASGPMPKPENVNVHRTY